MRSQRPYRPGQTGELPADFQQRFERLQAACHAPSLDAAFSKATSEDLRPDDRRVALHQERTAGHRFHLVVFGHRGEEGAEALLPELIGDGESEVPALLRHPAD